MPAECYSLTAFMAVLALVITDVNWAALGCSENPSGSVCESQVAREKRAM